MNVISELKRVAVAVSRHFITVSAPHELHDNLLGDYEFVISIVPHEKFNTCTKVKLLRKQN